MKRFLTSIAALTGVVFLMTGCGGGSNSSPSNSPAPPAVASVTVTPASGTIVEAQTEQFTATAKDSSGNTIANATFTWSSDNTAAATVDSSGKATGTGIGTAHVTASSGGMSGTATLVVNTNISAVTVTPATASISAGQTQQFGAAATDSSGSALTGKTFSWTSSDTGVATVDGTGKATAVAAGTATITATSDGVNGTAALTVTAAAVAVSISPTSASVQTSATQQFTASVTGSTNTAVNWSVNGTAGGDSTVGTVSASGLYTAPASVPNPATVTVTATSAADATQSASASVAVTAVSSGNAAATTDANGMATLTANGVTIPIQLVDPVTGQPLQGVNVALGMPASPMGVATLIVNDPSGVYPFQFVPLKAASFTPAPAVRSGRSLALTQQSSGTAVSVPVQLGCPSTLPTDITASAPLDTTYVPPPDPSLPTPTVTQIAQAYWEGGTNAMQSMAVSLGLSFAYTDTVMSFSGNTAAADCKNQILQFAGQLATGKALGKMALYTVETLTGAEVPEIVSFGLEAASTTTDIMDQNFSGCSAWWNSVTIRSVQFGGQTYLMILPAGTYPPSTSFSDQTVTVTPPAVSSLCFVSATGLGDDFAGATDNTGTLTVSLPGDNYTVGATSEGYSTSSTDITVPAPGQPISTAGVTLVPVPTAPPPAGTYAGTCVAQGTPITCCDSTGCTTTPAPPPTSAPFNFTLTSGTSLTQFSSDVCTPTVSALSSAGCEYPSCYYTANTNTSAQFTLSCTVAGSGTCSDETVSETCSANLQ